VNRRRTRCPDHRKSPADFLVPNRVSDGELIIDDERLRVAGMIDVIIDVA